MKEEQHLHVREIREALERIGGKRLGQIDAGFLSSPEVIFRMRAERGNEANGLNLQDHRFTSSLDVQQPGSAARGKTVSGTVF